LGTLIFLGNFTSHAAYAKQPPQVKPQVLVIATKEPYAIRYGTDWPIATNQH